MEGQFFTDTEQLSICVAGGDMPLFLVKPRQYGPFPALLLCMGMYGLTASVRSLATLLAERGFAVFVPDLYYAHTTAHSTLSHGGSAVSEPHAAFHPGSLDEALDAMHLLDEERSVADLGRATHFIAGRRDVRPGALAAMGVCMGAKWSLLYACENPSALSCVSCYYPTGLESCLEGILRLNVPVQIVAAGQDLYTSTHMLERFRRDQRRCNASNELLSFDAGHDFLDFDRPTYDPLVAAQALERTVVFFDRHQQLQPMGA